jgi:hypothetical protein
MTEPLPTSDLDLLMSLDPLELTKSDLSAIVAYHRKLRAEREAGKGRAARAANAPKVKLDLAKLGLVATPGGGSMIKRRV